MAKKNPFTTEQIYSLEQNPYTYSVSPERIVFTLEFKQFFAEQMDLPGMTTRKILHAAGYDSSLFPRSTMDDLRIRIRKELKSPEGLKPPRGMTQAEKNAVFAAKDLSKQRTDTSIRDLQERIVHLEKQVEFLKKISHLNQSD